MKQSFYVAVLAVLVLAGCKGGFKTTKDGLQYKIISDDKGKKVKDGTFFEIQFDQTYKDGNIDTTLVDSKNIGNQIVPMDPQTMPPTYYNIFKQLRNGDSLIIKQPTDSMMKMGGQVPAFIKKGQFIVAHYKIVNLFESREDAEKAFQAQMKIAMAKDSINAIAQLAKDDKVVSEYLSANKITATKAPKGTYVEILTPGTGDAIDTGKVAKVLYTGKTLPEGTVFDSNTDPKFGHPEALSVRMSAPVGGQGSVIKGWTDGLSLLHKGAKARFYIPSALAYGSRGAGKEIKPNQNLIFDIEVVDVVTSAQADAEQAAEQKKMMEKQKHMMDSLQRAAKDTGKKKR